MNIFKRNLFCWLSAQLLLAAGCAEKIVSECELEGAGRTQGIATRFSAIQSGLFNVHCALSGCHAGPAPAMSLDLTPLRAYAQLVEAPSREMPALKLVEPGSSSSSFLMKKLLGEETSIMPPSGAIAAAVIDSVAAWIDAGAAEL